VHPDPDRSLSDAAQTITLEALERIIERGRALHSLLAEEPVFESVTTILRA
jgi:3-deoxy-D-arabino-heptulosonate 7-phosphate (DAHP) synthase